MGFETREQLAENQQILSPTPRNLIQWRPSQRYASKARFFLC